MRRYQCTCMLENGEKYCPVHKKRMNRNFWKYEEDQQYEEAEEDNNEY